MNHALFSLFLGFSLEKVAGSDLQGSEKTIPKMTGSLRTKRLIILHLGG